MNSCFLEKQFPFNFSGKIKFCVNITHFYGRTVFNCDSIRKRIKHLSAIMLCYSEQSVCREVYSKGI